MADDLPTGAAKPGAETPSGRTAPAANFWLLCGAIVLVAWSCFCFPQAIFTQVLDSSWAAVYIYAHEKGLQFGRDLVCTYGPLGFLSIRYFSPHTVVARIFFEVILGGGIATGLCLLAWRLALPWRLAMLGFFIFLATPFHIDGDALYLDSGLVAWGLLCFLESGPRLRFFVPTLAILAAVGALVKFTFLVTGLFTIVLLACDLALRGQRALAVGIVLGFLSAFLLGWSLLVQSPAELGAYLSTSFGVASGYNAAMGSSAVNLAWVLIMTVAALAAVTIRTLALKTAGAEWPSLRRGALLVWLGGLLFVEWKYGCVRRDPNHVVLMLGVVPIAAMGMEALPAAGKRVRLWSRAATLICLCAGLLFMQGQLPGFALGHCVTQTFRNLSESFAVLAQPARYVREKTEALQAEQQQEQLPGIRAKVGRATADIFGLNQEFAFPNELNYQPRPVFQSYAAYTRPMMELNEQFYLSKNAPEYVLFTVQTIDHWFPPLADGVLLRHLLVNYALVGGEADYLLLRQKGAEKVRLTLLKEGNIRAGEKLEMQNAGDAMLWLEIDLQPTLFERLRRFLYRPGETQLVVWGQGEAPLKFRAPAAMLSAGFLANPLLLDTQAVLGLYTGGKPRLASAFSVEPDPGFLSAWQPQIPYRIYRIEK